VTFDIILAITIFSNFNIPEIVAQISQNAIKKCTSEDQHINRQLLLQVSKQVVEWSLLLGLCVNAPVYVEMPWSKLHKVGRPSSWALTR